MRREDRFVQSHRPYAAALSTLAGRQHPLGHTEHWAYSGSVRAVWYRRRRGHSGIGEMATVACVGTLKLWPHSLKAPLDLTEPTAVLSADLDGRYGGDCESRWDGASFWSAVQDPAVQAAHLEMLRPMLAGYPACPDPYSGWWAFR